MSFLCRACLIKVDIDSSTDLFSEIRTGVLISEVLTNLAPIYIFQGDGLPDRICLSCEKKLIEVLDFRSLLISSNSKLQKLAVSTSHNKSFSKQNVLQLQSIELIEDDIKIEPETIQEVNCASSRNFLCDSCEKANSNQSILEKHLPIQDPDKPFICYDCDKAFTSISLFQEHKKLLHNETGYRCHKCGVLIQTDQSLENEVEQPMSENEEIYFEPCSPPNVKNAATQNLLPEKSKTRYEQVYITYKNWCSEKSVTNIGSENAVLAYFVELSKTKKSSSLWAVYSMLRSTLKIKDNIDISKCSKLVAFLKKRSIGYKPKKSSTFTNENIDNFLKTAPLEYLPQKVALIIGISGACRSHELFKMRISDIDILPNKISVQIPDIKTNHPRACIISNPEWTSIIKKYVAMRNNCDNERFFLQLRRGKITRQPFGHNTIATFAKKIAAYLKLQNVDSYTGHSFRRTAITLFVNRGDILELKRSGRWKSSAIAESYVASSVDNQVTTADMLSTGNLETDIHEPGPSSISAQNSNLPFRTNK